MRLANGDQVPFDRLLIATGTRARQWPNPMEAALEAVYTLRSRDDAARLDLIIATLPEAAEEAAPTPPLVAAVRARARPAAARARSAAS